MNEDALVLRNQHNPLLLRALEALSTSMLIGVAMRGIPIISPLGLVCAFHWLCSANYHLFPNMPNFYVDILFIDLVAVERVSFMMDTDIFHPLFAIIALTNLMEQHRLVIYVKIMMVLFLVCPAVHDRVSVEYVLSWFYCGVLFMMSDALIARWCLRLKVVVHTLFHISLGYNSFLEVPYYQDPMGQRFTWLRLATYGVYLCKGWHLWTRQWNTITTSVQ